MINREIQRESRVYTLPSGTNAKVYEMTGKDINAMLSDSKPQQLFYQLLEEGIELDPDGNLRPYNPRTGWLADNSAGLVYRRIVTNGEDFTFPIKCSNDRCEYGNVKKGGKREFHTISLADQITDPDTEELIDNPYAIQEIFWEDDEYPASEGKGIDRKTGRFIVVLPRTKIKVVSRILRGAVDDKELTKIAQYEKKKRATESMKLKTVVLLDDMPDPDMWRTAENVEPPPGDFFEKLPYKDIEFFNETHEFLEGGMDTGIDLECPLCDNPLHNLQNSDQIPLMSANFFSSDAAHNGKEERKRIRKTRRKKTSAKNRATVSTTT